MHCRLLDAGGFDSGGSEDRVPSRERCNDWPVGTRWFPSLRI